MSTLLASRIKNRRKELKMSQKELAEGICKQGQISRLENGEYIPGSVLLYELSRKLKVSMDYFFDEQISSESNELNNFKKLSKTFIMERDYESLNYIYELEKETSHRLSLSDKIYMEWIESLIDFYFYHKKGDGIFKLEKAIKQLKETDIHYLQILNSLFNFYYETDNLDRFKEIENDLSARIEQLSLITIEELELAIKFNYNLGRYLWLQSKTEEAIKKLTLTIKLCKEFNSTYLLADLYLLLGNICEDFSDQSEARKYFDNALYIYKHLDDNKEMALRVEHYISKMFK